MFRITRKADYAVFILSFLARRAAEPGDDDLVSAQELASFSALNKSLVANLMKDLNRAGFLTSVRGARGGYRLAKPAAEIDLAGILEAVEGPFTFVECAGHSLGDIPSMRHALQGPGHRAVQAATDDAAADADADDDGCCNLSSLCTSHGALLLLHRRIRQLLQDIKLTELSGLDRSRAQDIAQELFPSRRELQRRIGEADARPGSADGTPDRSDATDYRRVESG
ncbi:MAG: Rrf2 family transcriptional regulator [Planctomycetes bacterium]|nr:Rrf2 family transcriptional regulator [Planctomycetota bacterium]